MGFLPVSALPARDLERRLDAGDPLVLVDVRTPAERAICAIEGSRLLDQEERNRLAALPKDTPIVFICHKGTRSMAAAVRYAAMGYSELYNLTGGIEAWARDIEPEMTRY